MLEKMNEYGKRNIPFLFILDFELKQPIILPLAEAAKQEIYFDIRGQRNFSPILGVPQFITFDKHPISFQKYEQAFHLVQQHLRLGDSFLTNLTFPTSIETNLSLAQIFEHSNAPYRLLFKDQFTVFSPEPFIHIKDKQIASFPMKGTIDANVPNAAHQILTDAKERAEHNTIVDLIRNDLSRVAQKVRVEQFRYIDRIKTSNKDLLQISSKIIGQLADNYSANLGDIFAQLLPAGSICGAPKSKTVEIIKQAEGYDRGYYTGVFGYYKDAVLESGVMIRFIEQGDEQLYYKSGGGITAKSNAQKEYQELIDKVYVPIHRKHSHPEWASEQLSLAH